MCCFKIHVLTPEEENMDSYAVCYKLSEPDSGEEGDTLHCITQLEKSRFEDLMSNDEAACAALFDEISADRIRNFPENTVIASVSISDGGHNFRPLKLTSELAILLNIPLAEENGSPRTQNQAARESPTFETPVNNFFSSSRAKSRQKLQGETPIQRFKKNFEDVIVNGKKFSKCNLCPPTRKLIANCGNTTNLHQHFNIHHQTEHKNLFPERYQAKRKGSVDDVDNVQPTPKTKQTNKISGMFNNQASYKGKMKMSLLLINFTKTSTLSLLI